MSIGANLKRIRTERGMSQTALAKAVFIDSTMITKIERGTKAMSLPLAIEVAHALGCSVLDFIDGEGQ